jgi:hypothetical protein
VKHRDGKEREVTLRGGAAQIEEQKRKREPKSNRLLRKGAT